VRVEGGHDPRARHRGKRDNGRRDEPGGDKPRPYGNGNGRLDEGGGRPGLREVA